MEVYILDSLLRREQIVDKFESLIWTDRWTQLGDFELHLPSTLATRSQFLPGIQVASNVSYRVMTVETVEDKTDGEGKEMLSVKGRSLETLLEDRAAISALSAASGEAGWVLTGPPASIARAMFDHICRTGALSLADQIPFLMPGTIFPASTIPEPAASITWDQKPDSLYNAIKAICDKYELGFRLVRNFDTSQLYFDIYAGNDRTTAQTVLPAVVFAPEMDNLQNTTEFTTIQNSKNVALVYSDEGTQEVYADGVFPDVSGFERRVLLVSADATPVAEGQTATTEMITAHLIQRGKEALATNRGSTTFDGELNQRSAQQYDVGDRVEMRNRDGATSKRRITELIHVDDGQGERSYPTLSSAVYDENDTWLSEDARVWEDFDINEYWANQ